MTTPTAPALNAFVVLTAKGHVPRLMRAILPAGKPAQSPASHPVTGDGMLTSAVTSPLPEYSMIDVGIGPAGGGEIRSRIVGERTMKVWNRNSCTETS